jgi:hypothetical protein
MQALIGCYAMRRNSQPVPAADNVPVVSSSNFTINQLAVGTLQRNQGLQLQAMQSSALIGTTTTGTATATFDPTYASDDPSNSTPTGDASLYLKASADANLAGDVGGEARANSSLNAYADVAEEQNEAYAEVIEAVATQGDATYDEVDAVRAQGDGMYEQVEVAAPAEDATYEEVEVVASTRAAVGDGNGCERSDSTQSTMSAVSYHDDSYCATNEAATDSNADSDAMYAVADEGAILQIDPIPRRSERYAEAEAEAGDPIYGQQPEEGSTETEAGDPIYGQQPEEGSEYLDVGRTFSEGTYFFPVGMGPGPSGRAPVLGESAV